MRHKREDDVVGDADGQLLGDVPQDPKPATFRGFVPKAPNCFTSTCKYVTIVTTSKAVRRFTTVENFLGALRNLDEKEWRDLEKYTITINEEKEEFEVRTTSNEAQTRYNLITKLRQVTANVIQKAVVDVTLNFPAGTRRICFRVARFGEKYMRYCSVRKELIDPTEKGVAIKVKNGETYHEVKFELDCSTRYGVKYCVTAGEKDPQKKNKYIWSEYSEAVQVRTPSEDQPPPLSLEPKPGGKLGIHLPKLPPNSQHLTLWLKRKNGEFLVFDYLTKKVVKEEGRAIPIWDFGRYVELKLEPNTSYTVKYSLMQNDDWNKSSFETTARTLKLEPWIKFVSDIQKKGKAGCNCAPNSQRKSKKGIRRASHV